ncbi:hypothetical protein ATK17_1182 [Branchiibius hedensis]|uniref:PQQ-like domain-containing protein n=1 Tax=Branchiibius hedensis TaxID=672460 RepID=A0A2Y8ZPM0_9MICO|nr:hypothetical protein [Branchiibius hedensis]PWJ25070.1 hypothetical protein ATK17_1182 [Branchiibius hedensis]SSA33885.1 hypothetical protein SAMN04489750_1182 [Branchiibius hedensis]
MFLTVRRAALALSLVAGLAACSTTAPTQSGTPSRSTPSGATPSPVAVPAGQRAVHGVAWTRKDIEPATEFTVVGSTVFFLGVQRNQLYAFGLDLANGKDRFRIGASPSGATQGVAVGYGTLGDTVAFYGENEDLKGSAPMWLVNLKTGKQTKTNKTLWRATPQACDHDRAFCGRTEDTTWRADLRTGELTSFTLPTGRTLGDGLSDPLQRDPEMLTYTKDGVQQWSLPLQTMAPGASTDRGWWTWSDDRSHMVGIDLFPGEKKGGAWQIDLGKIRSLGIEQASGHVAWTGRGQLTDCGASHPGEQPAFVRCAVRGTEIITGDGPAAKVTYQGLDVTIQGFNPATGTATWQIPLGSDPHNLADDSAVPSDARGWWIYSTGHGYVAVDPVSGAHDTAVGDQNWCEYRTTIVIRPEMTAEDMKRVGSQTAPCDRAGRRTNQAPRTINTTITPVHQGLVLTGDADSVSALRVSPR